MWPLIRALPVQVPHTGHTSGSTTTRCVQTPQNAAICEERRFREATEIRGFKSQSARLGTSFPSWTSRVRPPRPRRNQPFPWPGGTIHGRGDCIPRPHYQESPPAGCITRLQRRSGRFRRGQSVPLDTVRNHICSVLSGSRRMPECSPRRPDSAFVWLYSVLRENRNRPTRFSSSLTRGSLKPRGARPQASLQLTLSTVASSLRSAR